MTTKENCPAGTEQIRKDTNHNIPKMLNKVKNPLRKLRLEQNASPVALTDKVKQAYPGFDLGLYGKCERTDEYGVELCAGAMQLLKGPVTENRTLPCRVSCRMSAEDHAALMKIVKARGHSTVQAFLLHVLAGYIRRYRRAA